MNTPQAYEVYLERTAEQDLKRLSAKNFQWIDPTAASAHKFDIKLYNVGTSDLFGQVVATFIIEAVGTPALPTTKECTCPYCGNKQVESVHATRIKCKNCGREYAVYDLTRIRETR